MTRDDEQNGRDVALQGGAQPDTGTRGRERRFALPRDGALVQRLRDGDEAAFADLIRAYHGRLVRLALSFVDDHATAEEVVQETWLGVLNGLATFEGRSALKTWIFRILVNKAKTRSVREARMVAFSDLGDADSEGEPAVDPARFTADGRWADPPRRWADDTPEALLLRREVREHLEQAVQSLPPRQRVVLVLRDIEAMSAAEVCGILEIAETNQRVLLHRARSVLHRAMDSYVSKE